MGPRPRLLSRLKSRFTRANPENTNHPPSEETSTLLNTTTATELPPEKQLCPPYEDFGADASALFNLDTIEGCRLVLTSHFGRDLSKPDAPVNPILGESTVSYTLNLGTYPKIGSQADILRALLHPNSSDGADGSSKGGSCWSALYRWASAGGKASVLARYASRTGFVDGRAVWKMCDSVTLRGNMVSPAFFTHLGGLMRSTLRPWTFRQALRDLDLTNDMGSVVLERHTSESNLTAQVSYQDTPLYKLGYSNQLTRKLNVGGDLTVLGSSGAVLTSYGFRWLQGQSAAISASLSSSPNFAKSMVEGLKERVYGLRGSYVNKLTDRIALSGEVDVPLSDLKRTVGRLGYEVQFTQARVMGCLDTDLKLQTTVEDIAGVQLSGEMDFANDNYKFGFGFELMPQRRSAD